MSTSKLYLRSQIVKLLPHFFSNSHGNSTTLYKMPVMYQAVSQVLYKCSQLSSQQSPEALLILLLHLYLVFFAFSFQQLWSFLQPSIHLI